MRLTILSMISSSSLAAFSQSNAVTSLSRPRAVQQVRSLGTGQQATSGGARLQSARVPSGLSTAPTRIMPRGSLLDLSV